MMLFSNTDISFMRHAVALSQEKMGENCGGPFGAVIVKGDKIVAQGWNTVTSENDPTGHAEVNAIRKACQALGDFSLVGHTLYTSCEPCPMCLAAAYWARVEHVFYANTRKDAANIGFDDSFIYDEISKPLHAQHLKMTQIVLPEAQKVFECWAKKEDKIHY